MNESTISNRPRNLSALILSLTLLVMLLIVVTFLWHSHAQSKDQLQELSVQNSRLQEELEAARQEIDNLNSGDSSQTTQERLAGTRQSRTSLSAPETAETFILQAPSLTQSAAGLTVLLPFEPITSGPFDSIALVVRVPASSDGRIMAIEPTDESLYANMKTHIDASGTFAVFQGTPADLKLMQINLTVSGPTKASVQGAGGIKGFELDITPEQVESRNL